MSTDEQNKAARQLALESQAEVERIKKDVPPSESPTTFSDCAALYHSASAAYGQAAKAYAAHADLEGNLQSALGAVLMAAGDSCVASAKGQTIEV